MSESNRTNHACGARKRPCVRMVAASAMALVVFLALLLGGVAHGHSVAYADTSITPKAAVSSSSSQSDNHNGASGNDSKPAESTNADKDAAAEQNGIQGIEVAIVAGIVVVAALFIGWIARLNRSMREMKDSMHSK